LAHPKSLDQADTHRLIPAKYIEGSVLEKLGLPAQIVADLTELDAATNERKLAERQGIVGIGPGELLAGVPEARVVNAAFCHPGPHGSRFNDSTRGAWYGGFEIETTLEEVAFHKRRFLVEGRIQGQGVYEYIEYLADFSGSFHFLDAEEHAECLHAGPVPQCYQSSQALARRLLFEGSNGIVYPSVRCSSGTCIVCFRPALVYRPRRGQHYQMSMDVSKNGFEVAVVSATH
jgi:RES domain